jgi:hypothetical protein
MVLMIALFSLDLADTHDKGAGDLQPVDRKPAPLPMFREEPLQRQKTVGEREKVLMEKPAGKKNMAGLPDEGKKPGH